MYKITFKYTDRYGRKRSKTYYRKTQAAAKQWRDHIRMETYSNSPDITIHSAVIKPHRRKR